MLPSMSYSHALKLIEDRKQFKQAKMWLGLTSDLYQDDAAQLDHEFMYDSQPYMPPVVGDIVPIQPALMEEDDDCQKGAKQISRQAPTVRLQRSNSRSGSFSSGERDQKPSGKQSVNPSKRHRDRLNVELDNMAKLLPFPEDVIARLDKLSILRLSVSYLQNKNFFKEAFQGSKEETPLKCASGNGKKADRHHGKLDKRFHHLFNEAVDGFILVVTMDGEIFFVSENVKDFLGYSQSQILHQPLSSLVHDDDVEEMTNQLKGGIEDTKVAEIDNIDLPEDMDFAEDVISKQREFIVRLKSVLNTTSSDMFKPFSLTGMVRRLDIRPECPNLKHALFAFCAPARTSYSMLEIRMKSSLFCSKNRIDLSFLDMDARGKEYFGYTKKDIFGRSSYVLVHRMDLQHLRCKHSEIMTCGKSTLGTFRLLNKSNEWKWVAGYARVLYKSGKPDFVVTTNRIMSDDEGQAMLHIRDEYDYKALSALGLVEPDDPVKALELGFPNRAISSHSYNLLSTDFAMPLPLADGCGTTSSYFDSVPQCSPMGPAPVRSELPDDFLSASLFDVSDELLESASDEILESSLSQTLGVTSANYGVGNFSPAQFLVPPVHRPISPSGSSISSRTGMAASTCTTGSGSEAGDCVSEPFGLQPRLGFRQPWSQASPMMPMLGYSSGSSSSSIDVGEPALKIPRVSAGFSNSRFRFPSASALTFSQSVSDSASASLFEDLSSLDHILLQPRIDSHASKQISMQPRKASATFATDNVSNFRLPQMASNIDAVFRTPSQPMGQVQDSVVLEGLTQNLHPEQLTVPPRGSGYFDRSNSILSHNVSVYDQLGPNVTLVKPEYDLASLQPSILRDAQVVTESYGVGDGVSPLPWCLALDRTSVKLNSSSSRDAASHLAVDADEAIIADLDNQLQPQQRQQHHHHQQQQQQRQRQQQQLQLQPRFDWMPSL